MNCRQRLSENPQARASLLTSAPASLESRHEEVGLPRRHQGLYECPGGGDAGGGALQPARQDGRCQEAGALRDALLPKGAAWRLRDTAVARWLERAGSLDPVYRLFLGTVYNPRSYLEQPFLRLVQALQVYHRRALY